MTGLAIFMAAVIIHDGLISAARIISKAIEQEER